MKKSEKVVAKIVKVLVDELEFSEAEARELVLSARKAKGIK